MSKTDAKYIQIGKKQDLIDLEKFYVDAKLDNLNELVEAKKQELINKLTEISQDEKFKDKFLGNTYLISTYFFKTINPLPSIEPEYSSEKLSIVWQLYMYLVEQVNINIGAFKPTLSHFCKFAGISTNTMRNYKNNSDMQMRIVAEKIYDETFDSNVTMAEMGVTNSRATLFRMKSENEVQEQPQVKVSYNVSETVDLDKINEKLSKYSNYRSKKQKVSEANYREAFDDE